MAGRGAQSDHKLSTINEEHADDVLAKVNEFEKLVNPENEEQVKLLKEMKEHATRIKYKRGDWNKLTHFRSWNAYREPQPKPPMAIDTLREYKEHQTGRKTLKIDGNKNQLMLE